MKSTHLLKIILASASPRRFQILQEQGFDAVVMPANIEEILQEGEDAKSYVTRLAREKAQTILSTLSSEQTYDLILAADTTVAYQSHILEKPYDREDAYRMLRLLSGNSHEVYTGYALIFLPTQQCWVDYVTTKITFHKLTDEQIQNYIDIGEPFDKAGAYGIQQVHDTFIKETEGSFYNVMGLPIEVILQKIASVYDKPVDEFMAEKANLIQQLHKEPADFQKLLLSDMSALAAWEDITPLARNEWICWIESAKKQETRSRRIERACKDLKEGKRRPCCWPGCTHRR